MLRLALIAAWLSAGTASPAAPADSTTVTLRPGAEAHINVAHLARLAVEDVKIADVKPEGASEICVKGISVGSTQLLLWTSDGQRRELKIVVDRKAGPPRTIELKPDDTSPPLPVLRPRADAPLDGPKAGGVKLANPNCDERPGSPAAAAEFDAGMGLFKDHKFAQAIERFRKATELEPSSGAAHMYLGTGYARMGEGAREYETFALSCPDDARARQVRELLRQYYASKGLEK